MLVLKNVQCKGARSPILAPKHFEVYLRSSHRLITTYTNHNLLVFGNQMHNSNRRLMHWALFLQPFNVAIQHVKGKDNVLAETLFRIF